MRASPRQQSGVALMMVLLAFALAGIFTTGMMSRQSLMIQGTGNYLTQSEAQSLALGAEAFARQILWRDWQGDRESDAFVDDGNETWAANSVALPVERGAIEAQINDLQGRLNLNDLVDSQGQVNPVMAGRFGRLLEALDVRSVTVEAMIDWIDPDNDPTGPGGSEDGDYLLYDPPYRAADRPMTDLSELRLIDGMSREDYQRLLPHVAVLPMAGQPLNVNMMTVPVIQSLHEDITTAAAESVAEARAEARFETVGDFLAREEFAGMGLDEEGLTVRSFFFQSASRVTVADNVYRLVSTLHRDPEGELSVIARDAGQTGIITKERVSVPEG
ncbi:MAG: type II secretion system minor pseudopilin GspK [Oleiphilaceae bacterium]|nr:type II secretion system minor pseudopilin GspK [Oleiphilaceae bacterium]